MVLGDVCMDFEPYFKVHNLFNVHPENIKLGQMINLDMIFYVMVSNYRLAKIWNSPQFPVEFRNGLRVKCLAQEHNTMSRPVLEPRPLTPESSALTMRPPRLPHYANMVHLK